MYDTKTNKQKKNQTDRKPQRRSKADSMGANALLMTGLKFQISDFKMSF